MQPVQDLRFGPFRLDLRTGELRKRDTRIRLRPQSLDLLLLLLEHPGEVVLRDEIRSKLWPQAAAGDFDQGINAAMRGLRTALMDSAEQPTWVETLPKRGYRFIGTVEKIASLKSTPLQTAQPPADAAEPGNLADEEWTEPEELPSESPSLLPLKTADRHRFLSPRWILLFATLACLAALAVWRPFHTPIPMAGTLGVSRVTSTGDIVQADIAHNGESVAYVRDTQGRQSLWLKQFSKEGDIQLADCGEKHCGGPVFSPDATSIYFTRRTAGSSDGALFRVSVLGGAPEPILSGINGTPALSPDGRRLAFVRSTLATQGQDTLITSSITGANERELVRYTAPGIHHSRVVWTADGKRLVYMAMGKLTTILADGGKESILPDSNWDAVEDIFHSPYGAGEVLVAGNRIGAAAPLQIFRTSLFSPNTTQLTHDQSRYIGVSATSDGRSLLALEESRIRTIDVLAPGEGDARPAMSDSPHNIEGQWGVAWTPDRRILFSGQPLAKERGAIWLMNPDGSGRQRITNNADETFYADARMDPSGSFVVATVWSSGDQANLWRFDVSTGARMRLTSGHQDFPPAISPDGRWVVYTGIEKDRPVLMKVLSEGGTPIPLTTYRCERPALSPDGNWIACFSIAGPPKTSELFVVPFTGGPPINRFTLPPTARLSVRPVWTRDGCAISFVNRINGVSNVWNQPANGGVPVPVTRFPSREIFHLDWSLDNRLVLSRGEDITDAMLIRSSPE